MDRYFLANVSTTPPSLPVGAVKGYPQDGDPTSSKLPTIMGAYALWQIFEELLNLQTAGGETADPNNLGQVAAAVEAIANAAAAAAAVAAEAVAAADATTKANAALAAMNAEFTGAHVQLGVNGWQDFPSGTIRQRSTTTITPDGNFHTITYPKPFPHTCYGPRLEAANPGATSGSANNFVGVTLKSFTLTDCVIAIGAVNAGGPSVDIMLDVEGD